MVHMRRGPPHHIRIRIKKLKAVELFGNTCHRCGNTYHPAVFEFHHIDPTTKNYHMSALFGQAWNVIEQELKLCIMLCANCHRLTHVDDEDWVPSKYL